MFRLGKQPKKLHLTLPAVEQPLLGASPSQRIMAIANRRSVAYGFLFAAILSGILNILFAVILFQRIEVNPYVADGSSYGCSPQIVDNPDAIALQSRQTPQMTGQSADPDSSIEPQGDQ